jgi:hypothetical protein
MPPLIRTELLVVTGVNFPPYSTRTAQQQFAPIPQASQLARTVNGDLADLSDPLFRKFRTTITTSDQQLPEFVWPGSACVVDWIAEFAFLTAGGTQIRNAVEYSERTEGDYTFYRPRMNMRVVDWQANYDDWGAIVGWTINLEETTVDEVIT